MKMEATGPSEALMTTYQTTRRHISEDIQRLEDHASYNYYNLPDFSFDSPIHRVTKFVS
jgi:hypothetical protein